MKVINLDKFKTVQFVEFDGEQYEIYAMNVDMYINDGDLQKLGSLGDGQEKERILTIISILTKLSNITEEKLRTLQLPVLIALLQVAQGIDPTEEKPKEEESPNE